MRASQYEYDVKAFTYRKTQDEIGTRIYGGLGSKLSTAVSYFESLGFAAMFFTGTVEQFKELLDKGLPILVSLEFEQASHVQVVFGYDDELELFHVQDANFLSPTYVEYKNFDQHYANSGFYQLLLLKRQRISLHFLKSKMSLSVSCMT